MPDKIIGYGRILPDGNHTDFEYIFKQLAALNVTYRFYPTKVGGGIFVLQESELEKLPKDEDMGDRYLPVTDTNGFALYPIWQKDIDEFAAERTQDEH